MLDGLADDEIEEFLDDHPTIIPLFEINAIPTVEQPEGEEVPEETLHQDEPDPTTVAELRQARDAFERELAISQWVKASTFETINLGSDENPHTLTRSRSQVEGSRIPLLDSFYNFMILGNFRNLIH